MEFINKVIPKSFVKNKILKLGKKLGVSNNDILVDENILSHRRIQRSIDSNFITSAPYDTDESSVSLYTLLNPDHVDLKYLSEIDNQKLHGAATFISEEGISNLKEDIIDLAKRGDGDVDSDEFDELFIDSVLTHPSKQFENYGLNSTLDIYHVQELLSSNLINVAIARDEIKNNSYYTRIRDVIDPNDVEALSLSSNIHNILGLPAESSVPRVLNNFINIQKHASNYYNIQYAKTVRATQRLIENLKTEIKEKSPQLDNNGVNQEVDKALLKSFDTGVHDYKAVSEIHKIKSSLDFEYSKLGYPIVNNNSSYIPQRWSAEKIRDEINRAPSTKAGLDLLTDLLLDKLDVEEMTKRFVNAPTLEEITSKVKKSFKDNEFNPLNNIGLSSEAINNLIKDYTDIATQQLYEKKNISFVSMLPEILNGILRDIVSGTGKKTSKSSPQNMSSRFLLFKSLNDWYEINKLFGSHENMEAALYAGMDKQIKVMMWRNFFSKEYVLGGVKKIKDPETGKTRSKTINQKKDIDIFTLFDFFVNKLADVPNPEDISLKKEASNFLNNQLVSTFKMQSDYLLSPYPSRPFKGRSALRRMAQNLYAATALASLGVMSAVSDGFALAFMGKGVLGKSSVKLIFDYVRSLLNETSDADRLILGDMVEDMRAEGITSLFGLDQSDKLLDNLTSVSHVTERGHMYARSLLARNIGSELVNGTSEVLDNLIARGNLTKSEVSYLRKNADELVTQSNGRPILLLSTLDRNPLESLIQAKLIGVINEFIPINGLYSRSIKHAADLLNNPFGFLIKAQLMFKGVLLEQAKGMLIDPLLEGTRSKSVWGHMLLNSFYAGLAYHLLKSLLKGQIVNYDSETEDGYKTFVKIVMHSFLDSPNFGAIGSILENLISQGYQNPVTSFLPAEVGAAAKVPLGLKDMLFGEIGKSLNKEITAFNAFNPIHNLPLLGIAFDRLITDGLRELVYSDVDRYYNAVNSFPHDNGMRYFNFTKAGAFWGDR